MLALGGAVTVSVPVPFVNASETMRWSMSKACVLAPLRISATEAMLAAFGVLTWKLPP